MQKGKRECSSAVIIPLRLRAAVPTVLLLFLLIFIRPACAEEPRVFTNDDLSSYAGMPSAVDEDTLARKEKELRLWEKRREAQLKAEEQRQALLEQSRQEAARNRRYPSSAAVGYGSGPSAGSASSMAGAARAGGMAGAAAPAGGRGRPT